jgi:hypothetical protein
MNLPPSGQNQPTQLPEFVKNTTEFVGDAAASIGKGYESVKTNVSSSLSEFSEQANAGVGASQQFLNSNTIIAKFAFVILVIILFIILLGLGITLIQYMTNPSSNPYIIKGLISGSDNRIVSQDPTQKTAITVLRSNNQKTGLEFTWSVWLFISDLNNSSSAYQHVFSKGTLDFDGTTGIATTNNGPGLYIAPGMGGTGNSHNQNSIRIIMNNTGPVDTFNTEDTVIDIGNIPLKKWVHVAIRMENTIFDVYINGVIAERKVLQFIPKQNYNDILVCQHNGFAGNLSNLRYYNSALSVVQINNIVFWGPNLSANKYSGTNGGYQYLSSTWYTGLSV